jgi:hypothetical protein
MKGIQSLRPLPSPILFLFPFSHLPQSPPATNGKAAGRHTSFLFLFPFSSICWYLSRATPSSSLFRPHTQFPCARAPIPPAPRPQLPTAA